MQKGVCDEERGGSDLGKATWQAGKVSINMEAAYSRVALSDF